MNDKKTKPIGRSAQNPGGEVVIGFRMDADSHELLSNRARELGVSTHKLARSFVFDVLYDPSYRQALEQHVTTIHFEVTKLRADLALAVEALLCSAGKANPEEARAWRKENINRIL